MKGEVLMHLSKLPSMGLLLAACGGDSIAGPSSSLTSRAQTDAGEPAETASEAGTEGQAVPNEDTTIDASESIDGASAPVNPSARDASMDSTGQPDAAVVGVEAGSAGVDAGDDASVVVDASADGSSVVPDACAGPPQCGECNAGESRCNIAARTVETCSAGGVWTTTAQCRVQDQTCRMGSAGAGCVDDYFVGHSDAGPSWRVVTSSDILYAQRVTVAEPATLRGLYITTAVLGGACDLALYADEQGHPGAWLASVLNLPIETTPSGRAVGMRTELRPGVPYWVTASCGQSQGPAQLYQIDRTGEDAYRAAFPWGNLPPSQFPMAGAAHEPNVAYSLFIKVRSAPAL